MTVLLDLPHEMTSHIARFLPLSSAASFAHSCRTVLRILGTGYWQAIRANDQRRELERFLRILEVDLPGHVLCSHCVILRRMGHWCNRHRGAKCYESELFGGVYSFIHKGITFVSVAEMMKCYRQGRWLDYTTFLGQLSERYDSVQENFPYQLFSLARIVNGSLFLRVQESLLFTLGFPTRKPLMGHIAICAHVGYVGIGFDARFPEHVQCQLDHDHEKQQCIRTYGMRQCAYCPTEYQIELQDCADMGVALVVTKWLDLGEGRSVLDPKWWSRLGVRYTEHDVFVEKRGVYREKLMDRLPVPSEHPSIRNMVGIEGDPRMGYRKADEQSLRLDVSLRLQNWSRIVARLRESRRFFWDPKLH